MKSGGIRSQESDSQSLSSSNEECNAIKTKSKLKSKALSSSHSMKIKMLDDNNIESQYSSFNTDETKYIVFSFRKDGEFKISTNGNSKRLDSSEVDRLNRINDKLIHREVHTNIIRHNDNHILAKNESRNDKYNVTNFINQEEDEESQYMDSLSHATEIEIEEEIEEEYEHDDEMTFEEIRSSNGSKRSSFAFPVLASSWIGSPVKMPESAKHLRKERFWKLELHLCCKF